MEQEKELDYFNTLEEKVENIIAQLISLKDERASLKEKVREQEENIADLTGRLEDLMQLRDNARHRIESILDRIDQLDV